jgi:glycosyltransferase involved in cell wall biosynthesis
MRTIFRSWGFQSDVFSEAARILPELRRDAQDVSTFAATCQPDDIVLLHLSIGSPVNTLFRSLPCRKVILYHNVTPSHYFDLVNKQTAVNLARGREQVRALAGCADVVLADSAFNAGELEQDGYRDVKVLPLVLDLERLRGPSDPRVRKKHSDGRTNILFVGRCVPNKRIEDVLTAYAYYNHYVDGDSRLIHVGSFAGSERYYYLMLSRARELGLDDVTFAGSVPQDQLNAYYDCAHVFLCMSEHEGFCIPLIEAMVKDIPVLAYGAAAVPETLAGSGVVVREKQYEAIAEMLGKLRHDGAFRESVLQTQRRRIAEYEARDLEQEIRDHLSPLLEARVDG